MSTYINRKLVLLESGLDASSESTASPFQDAAGRLVLAMVVFFVVLYAVYLLYKHLLPKLGRGRGLKLGRDKNTKVLEITSVGPGSTIQLIKVSEEYFLIGVTKNSITFLTKTESPADSITENMDTEAGRVFLPFEKYLSRLFVKKDADAGRDSNGERK